MICQNCGNQIPDGSAVCPGCGAGDTPAPEPAQPSDVPEQPDGVQAADAAVPELPAAEKKAPLLRRLLELPKRLPALSKRLAALPKAVRNALRRIRVKNVPAFVFAAISVMLTAALILTLFVFMPAAAVPGSAAASASVAPPEAASAPEAPTEHPGPTPAPAAEKTAAPGSATPEDAVLSFAASLSQGDYDAALKVCAAESLAKRFDYTKKLERTMLVTPIGYALLPAEYPQYAAFNYHRAAVDILTQMINFTVSFNISDENRGIIDGTLLLMPESRIGGLIDELDPASLSSLETVKIAVTDDEADAQALSGLLEEAAVYGASDLRHVAVLYRYGGGYYAGGLTLLQYGNEWRILNMQNAAVGAGAAGVPAAVSGEAEFAELLGAS